MSRKPAKGSPRNYFTKETEDYIIKYNNCTDVEERNKIFTEHIFFPFYKLAECIIHTYKFYHTGGGCIEDLKLDVVTMLLHEKIHLFDPTRGAKAFSYFGTIVKRWLIATSKLTSRDLQRYVSVDSCEDFLDDVIAPETFEVIPMNKYVDDWIDSARLKIPELFKKEQDMIVADALLTVFKSRKDLKVFNKKAVFLYIRELTDCMTPRLTFVTKVLKADFYKRYLRDLEQGKLSWA